MIAIFVIALVLPASGVSFAERPFIGLFGITANSPRTKIISQVLEKNLGDAVTVSGVFEQVNSASITDQLRTFNCLDERCSVPFAKRAGISVVLKGHIEDREKEMHVTLYAYGTDIPFSGKMICRYTAEIPFLKGYGAQEFSMICGEHSLRFLSLLLRNYRVPVTVQALKAGRLPASEGTFPLYRKEGGPQEGMSGMKEIGSVQIREGKLTKVTAHDGEAGENDVAILGFREKGREMQDQARNSKREIVLERSDWQELIYDLIITVPASASMPVLAPTIGYFMNSDWSGLALWTINAPPYIYLEISGFVNMPHLYRRKNRDIPREVHAQYKFALYMLFTGGLALTIDASANQFLQKASEYEGAQPIIGSSLTAAYFSLVSGGAGHFYRGYRLWGYFYFHANNILMYFLLREFSYTERYNPVTDSYTRGRIDRARAYTLLGVYSLVKIVEIVHVLLLEDRIWNGNVREEVFAVEPVVYPDLRGIAGGVQVTYRY